MVVSPGSDSIACVDCGNVVGLYHCHPCSEPYCSNCQVDHCRRRHANQGTPYEIYQQVEAVLATEQNELLRRQLHDYDSFARWIGITMPDNITHAQPSLWGYSRVADLLTDNRVPEIQRPSLVSFIGRTGSGKSTLIRSLIRFGCQNTPTPGTEPITSSPNTAHKSTSSDVHLYSDPGTKHEEHPLLLADSEGLRGGPPESWSRRLGSDGVCGAVGTINNRRTITWALNEKADRMYIVGHLYPRFLYTFSDLICFVASTARYVGLRRSWISSAIITNDGGILVKSKEILWTSWNGRRWAMKRRSTRERLQHCWL
jgi:energy-coupling factor transporter ATP-binding protein EcfA2